jgi:hypothetical protein
MNTTTPNPRNIHLALQQDAATGDVELRTAARITNTDPIPVTLGSESVTITGDVTIPAVVKVENNGGPLKVDGVLDVNILDSAINSAFGRLRTANTRLLGEFRNQFGTLGPVEIVSKFDTGGSQTVNLAQANTLINVTAESGSRALRQSREYHAYIPGTTMLAYVSFKFDTPKTNLQQMVGMFDDDNGVFLRMLGTVPQVVIRRGGTDSQVISQANWNQDRLDGTGASGITIDLTSAQIFVLDYQWLGVGRVRVGFVLKGQITYVHHFENLNSLTEPYMYQPSLPVRWEIVNTGTTTGNSSLMCICFGVYAEGSDTATGFDNSVSTGTSAVTLGADADAVKGILAVRLKSTVNGRPMRATARLKDWQVVTNLTAQYKVMILQTQFDIAGSPSWTDASPTGWCEYTTNFSLVSPPTPPNAVVLFDGYATGGSNRGESSLVTTDNRSSAIHQNYDSTDSQIFVIVGYRIPNDNAVMRASMNWVELK